MDIKVGDTVISYDSNLVEHFINGPRKVVGIREIGGKEGDAIKCEGLKFEIWSNYLRKV